MRAGRISTSSVPNQSHCVAPHFGEHFGSQSIFLTLFLALVLSGYALLAQAPTREITIRLSPPTTVGRYSLESAKQLPDSDNRWLYRYFDGNSSRVDVTISRSKFTSNDGRSTSAMRRQAESIKGALLASRRSGRYDDYEIALDGVHTDTLAASPIPGYRIVAVVRRANRVYLVFFCTYSLHASIVQVHALIPQTDWRVTNVPVFADQLIAELDRED